MEIVLYGVVMLVAMTLAGVIGFAANVLALPVLSMFLPLKTAVAIALKASAAIARRMKTTIFQQLVNVVLLISAVTLMWQVVQGVMA